MQTRTALLALFLTSCAGAGHEGFTRPQRTLVPTAATSTGVDSTSEVMGGKGKGLDRAMKPTVASVSTPAAVFRPIASRAHPPPR